MKKYTLLVILSIISATGLFAQGNCCSRPSAMGLLALNADFMAAHLPPEPLNYSPEKGAMLSFETTDGKDGNAFFVPSTTPTKKVLIVVHEWWGLNDYIKREAERLQKELGNDVDVYAVDLYDGGVAENPDDASQMMSKLTANRADAILGGLMKKIGAHKKIATIGWCMGGSWSFEATLLAGDQSVGCVMYYGFPEKDVKKVKTLKSDVLYIYGNKDKFIKRIDVDGFGKRISAVGLHFDFHEFPADHAFANPSNPKFDKASASEANVLAIKFLQQHLGK